jgi:hypothetical protein
MAEVQEVNHSSDVEQWYNKIISEEEHSFSTPIKKIKVKRELCNAKNYDDIIVKKRQLKKIRFNNHFHTCKKCGINFQTKKKYGYICNDCNQQKRGKLK